MSLFDQIVVYLKPDVRSGVCLTFDIWSSSAKEDYITDVAHYIIADWELKKSIVGSKLCEVSHNGINMMNVFLVCLEIWPIYRSFLC